MRARCAVRGASIVWFFWAAACSPSSTRPRFAPVPEALRAVINAPPGRVALEAQAILSSDSVPIPIRYVSERDAFLETGEFAGTTRIRLWADPDVAGKARVTIEAVYRPHEDPSRTRRDLERAAPPESAGAQRANRLLESLKEKLGVTVY
jgi:hypothetical protein